MSDPNQTTTNKHSTDIDKTLDVAVRQYFCEHQPQPTSFEQLWQSAQADRGQDRMVSAATPQWSWLPISAAAAVFLSFIVFYEPVETPDKAPPITAVSDHIDVGNTLFYQLISTTSWTAPSDQLLKSQPRLKVWGVPNFKVQPAEEIL